MIDVLENDYPLPPTLSPAAVEFVNACKRDKTVFQGVSPIRDCFQAFVPSWKARKEKTVSIHHHMGHYKAILRDDNLCWMFFQRSEVPSVAGYSLLQHQEGVDLVITKKDNSPFLSRKRTLGLLDTEFKPFECDIWKR